MGKATPAIAALNAGEWTPDLDGRVDLQGYSASCKTIENGIPLVQGPLIRRPGTRFVKEVKASADRTWLMPFIRARDTAYVVEFGDLYCRFYINGATLLTGSTSTITGISQASPGVVTSAGHPYVDGDQVFITGVSGMTEINGRWFVVSSAGVNDFELTDAWGASVDTSGYTAYTSGGTIDVPYEITSPYALADLTGSDGTFQLDFVQSADVVYIAHRQGTYAMRKLSRTGATAFSFSTLDPDNGPFLDTNASTVTMYAGAATGSITITASSSTFVAGHVGALIRLDQEVLTATDDWVTGTVYGAGAYVRSEGKEYYSSAGGTSGTSIPIHTSGTVSDGGVDWEYISPGYMIARITAQAGTSCTATVLTSAPQTLIGSGNATTIWRFGAWSELNGYPRAVTFFKERLVTGQQERLDMSETAAFESFAIDSFGEILKINAISVTVQSDTADDIISLTAGDKALTVHTEGGEHVMSALTSAEAFGPGNVTLDPATTFGSAAVRPIRIGEAVLYVQSTGRNVQEQTFDLGVESFVARNLMVRANHLTTKTKKIVGMARQQEPYNVIWFWLDDGELLCLTYDRTQEVRGWAPQVIGGTSAAVESCAVIPSDDGAQDDLWVVVKRTVNGATKRYVEYLAAAYEAGDALEDAVYVDSASTYDSTAATVIYGLDHLEGETVRILADGASHADKTVTAGTVTVDLSTSVAQIGLSQRMRVETARVEAGASDGTSQTKTKRITDVSFRVRNTLGGSAGPDFNNLDDIPGLTFRDPTTPMDSGPDLVTGDNLVSWPGGYDTNGRVCYENDSAFPVQITMIVPQVVTQDSR